MSCTVLKAHIHGCLIMSQEAALVCCTLKHAAAAKSLQSDSVLGILQARILEWVTVPFSRGYSQPRD